MRTVINSKATLISQKDEIAQTIRTILIDVAANEGDLHLAGSLGVVELFIALFIVFDLETTKYVIDIGHQRSPYMMLLEFMKTGELTFPHIDETYDMFTYPGFAGLSV